ncbi:hypothetical protein EDB83DRAFT_2529909 [Lactarius deliciosus]|nr:hypothetical protein EDB83DRAFT_2536559 [Lactarius deliciosus]KAH9012622.1 hypothetical protein EDB83DRAFT_2529909 [Lactarius deliciosus]
MDPVVDTIFFLMGVLVLLSITRLPDGSLNTVQLALSGIIPSNALEMSTHFTITMWKSIVVNAQTSSIFDLLS